MRKAVLMLGLILVVSLSLAGVYGACSGTEVSSCENLNKIQCESSYVEISEKNVPCFWTQASQTSGMCTPFLGCSLNIGMGYCTCKNLGCSDNSACSITNNGVCSFTGCSPYTPRDIRNSKFNLQEILTGTNCPFPIEDCNNYMIGCSYGGFEDKKSSFCRPKRSNSDDFWDFHNSECITGVCHKSCLWCDKSGKKCDVTYSGTDTTGNPSCNSKNGCDCIIENPSPILINPDPGCDDSNKPKKYVYKKTYDFICCSADKIASYNIEGVPSCCSEENNKWGLLDYASEGSYPTSLCCNRGEEAAIIFPGIPIECCPEGNLVKGTGKYSFTGELPQAVCCNEGEIPRILALEGGQLPIFCCNENNIKFGRDGSKSICCKENGAVATTNSKGEPLECCKEENRGYGRGDYAKGKNMETSICCKEGMGVLRDTTGEPKSCCPNSRLKYGREEYSQDKISEKALCCGEGEDITTHEFGYPKGCCDILGIKYGIGDYAKGKNMETSICCKKDEKALYDHDGRPVFCTSEKNKNKFYCSSENPICPRICSRNKDAPIFEKFLCQTDIGVCSNIIKTSYNPNLGDVCVKNVKTNVRGEEIQYDEIDCNGFDNDKSCGSQCLDFNTIQKYVCQDGEGCFKGALFGCGDNQVCITHKSFSDRIVNAQCESCNDFDTLLFSTHRDFYSLHDGMEITIQGGEYSNQNIFFNFKTINEVFKFLNDACEKCSNSQRKYTLFLSNHGRPGLQWFGEPSVGYSYDEIALSTDNLHAIVEKNPKTIGCFKKIIFGGCSVGMGDSGAKFKNAVETELHTEAIMPSAMINYRLSDSSPCSISEEKIKINSNPAQTQLQTIFYSTNSKYIYPGFDGQGEAYQTKIISGNPGEVKLRISGNTKNNKIAEIEDEEMMCGYDIEKTQTFTLSASSPAINFDNLKIEILPETFTSYGESAQIEINKLKVDCTNFYLDFLVSPEDLINQGYNELFYGDYNNWCTSNEDCSARLCLMGKQDCEYKCISGECRMTTPTCYPDSVCDYYTGENFFSCPQDCLGGPDSNDDGILDNKEFLSFIFKTGDRDEKQRAKLWWMD
ncbi:hypothetical protein HYW76_01450 [Candidatus Pacearchaeota archaeon]|nr:hypothetical protein [Candidatus Pacearchaeota archaeon]